MITFDLLFFILAGLFFVLVVLFFYLVIQKLITNKNRRLIDSYKEKARLSVFHYLQDGKEIVLPKTENKEYETAIFELLNEYAIVMNDELVQSRLKNFATKYMYDFITNNLNKKQWYKRLHALYTIENFHLDNFQSELESHYNNKKLIQAEESQILKLYAIFNNEKLIDKMLHTKHLISNFELLSIFSHMDLSMLATFVDKFYSLPIHYQLTILDTIAVNNWEQYGPFLEQLLFNDEVEIQIRTLKVFAETDIPFANIDLEPFLCSKIWQLRLMAVKIAGVKKLDQYKNHVVKCLTDQEYVVRKEAAKAMLQFADGEQLLTNVKNKNNDPFAVDMAKEWLEKERAENFI